MFILHPNDSTFITAGQDTMLTSLFRLIEVLIRHPDYQRQLREEIIRKREECGGQDFDYDALMSLPLLDAIMRETLRLYPPVSLMPRTCVYHSD